MKRLIGVLLGLLLAAVLIWAGGFYWRHLRGLGPVIKDPPQDISALLAQKSAPGRAPADEKNTTGFPLKLPPGFKISIFAQDLGQPRVLALDPAGNLLVSIPNQGRVMALPDRNNDGVADRVITVAEHLQRPHGLLFRRDGDGTRLYIAEVELLAVYDYDEKTLRVSNRKKIADLPKGGRHWTRTMVLLPTPDNRLLISLGSSCDTCVEQDWRYAAVLAAPPDGSSLKIFAAGLRNAVFMALNPFTQQVWVTEMGRDFLGDELPPDEINILAEGKHYGWPYCYGKRVHDGKFDPKSLKKDFCQTTVPSHIDLPAHSAPLGLAFIPATDSWPKEYQHNLLVSYHGSWNRNTPTGYKVVRHKLDAQGKYLGVEDFITGWLTKDGALGRPVDIVIRNNGEMFISDDKAGVVYLVAYRN